MAEWFLKNADTIITGVLSSLVFLLITKLLSLKIESINKAYNYIASITLGKIIFFSIYYIFPVFTIVNFIIANYYKTLTFGETLPFLLLCFFFTFTILLRLITEIFRDLTNLLVTQNKHADISNGVINKVNELTEHLIAKNSQENQE
ncbi:hypothetical protein ACFFLS_06140 [Flavobacterium procerum]|uniref:Uncharacterized protein n=1 Tax=Flavobacterium procerum TaxID=1455569 RepID=A0ABV6BME2_9FLAO